MVQVAFHCLVLDLLKLTSHYYTIIFVIYVNLEMICCFFLREFPHELLLRNIATTKCNGIVEVNQVVYTGY
jgi:hypothetical protein